MVPGQSLIHLIFYWFCSVSQNAKIASLSMLLLIFIPFVFLFFCFCSDWNHVMVPDAMQNEKKKKTKQSTANQSNH